MFGEMRTSCSSSASTDRPPTLFNASGPPPTSQSAFAQVATRLACMVLLMIVAMQSATAQTAQPASADSAAQFRAHVFELVDTLPQTSSVLSIIWYAMTDLKGWAGFTTPLLYGVGALLIGWLGFMLLRPKRIRAKLNSYAADSKDGVRVALYSLLSLIVELAGVAIFYYAASIASWYFFDSTDSKKLLLDNLIWALTSVMIFNAVLRAILSPYNANLRLMPLPDAAARRGFVSLILIFGLLQIGMAVISFLEHMGMYEPLVRGAVAALTFTVNAVFILFIWASRKHFNAVFYPNGVPDSQSSGMSVAIHRWWPVALSVWLLVIWAVWSFNQFINNEQRAESVAVCWWITLSFPILDRCVQLILQHFIADKIFTSEVNHARGQRFVHVIQTGFRIVLLTFAVFTVTKAWGFQAASDLTANAWVQQIFDIIVELGIVAVVGFAIWEIVQGWAESKIPHNDIDPVAALELDGGGIGASRSETLLPLLRTVLSAFLAVFLALTALYVLGVEIGPLLAGAGVLGLAIGFGAQKLVQDIISGIFFLVDDAFRMNEYIEVGSLRGTVENISIRSLQLRHHLGAVQTIPYSEMATVKNLSRDWVTMKLELRVPYDTDIEKLRKTVKKVGQDLKKHPEHGGKFILPLKSQGVNRIEESALIIRVKFTCKPGDQWIIRRLAYQEIRDALDNVGINFAHREVRVHALEDDALPALEAPANMSSTEPTAAGSTETGTPDKDSGSASSGDSMQDDIERLRRRVASAASIAAVADDLATKYDTADGGPD